MAEFKYRSKAEQKSWELEHREEKPEGFASKNAKTITFIVTMVVLLALIGPISVFTIYRQMTDAEETAGAELTVGDIRGLAALGEGITMEHLRVYQGTESESEYRRSYIIQNESFILYAVADKSTGVVSVCLLTDQKTGDSIDLRYEDVETFLASH